MLIYLQSDIQKEQSGIITIWLFVQLIDKTLIDFIQKCYCHCRLPACV